MELLRKYILVTILLAFQFTLGCTNRAVMPEVGVQYAFKVPHRLNLHFAKQSAIIGEVVSLEIEYENLSDAIVQFPIGSGLGTNYGFLDSNEGGGEWISNCSGIPFVRVYPNRKGTCTINFKIPEGKGVLRVRIDGDSSAYGEIRIM